MDERRIDDAIDVAAAPRALLEPVEGGQLRHSRAVPIKRHAALRRRIVEVELKPDFAEAGRGIVKFVDEPPVEFSWRHRVGLSGGAVADTHTNVGLPNAVPQFGGQIPIQLLPAELANAWQQGPDVQRGARFRQQGAG